MRVFDLSHDLNNKTLRWPTATQFKVIPVCQGYAHSDLSGKNDNNYWLEMNDIVGAEHSGTHLDAPVHFAKDQWTVDQIPPDRFFGPVSIIDLRNKVKNDANYEITVDDLWEWDLNNNNRREFAPLIILWTGWGSRWPDRSRYFGTESESDKSSLRFPGLSRSAAQWLVDFGRIHGVGIDTPSIDFGKSKDFMAHRILLSNNIFLIENLNTKNLESFPIVNPYLMVTPLKITGGSGSPVRAIILSQLPNDYDTYHSVDKMDLRPLCLMALFLVFCKLFFN